MSIPAPVPAGSMPMAPKPQLLQQLRQSFSQGSGLPAAQSRVMAPDVPIAPTPASPVHQLAPSTPPSSSITQTDALDTLDQVLQEVEQMRAPQAQTQAPASVQQPQQAASPTVTADAIPSTPVFSASMAAAVPQAVAQATDTLNPAVPAPAAKEKFESGSLQLDQRAPDAGGGAQAVELEHSVEIPVEVEAYLQEVKDHHQQPQEVVISTDSSTISTQQYAAQPVIVLPITPEIETVGQNKSPKLSIRWLVEWSRKLMKMFSGKAIYRTTET